MDEELPDYSGHETQQQGTDLELLAGLAGRLSDYEVKIKEAEAVVKDLSTKAREIAWFEIPELMETLGVKEFTLTDGSKITLKVDIRCSLPKDVDKRAIAMAWLNENGAEGLMRREFGIVFDKGEEEWAEEFLKELEQRDRPLSYERREGIHASTLKKFIAEKLERGETVPMDVLGAHRQTIAKVK